MIKLAQQIRDFSMIPLYRKFDEYQKGFYSPAIINQCMGTIAVETEFTALRQDGYDYDSENGAFGPPQIEPDTLQLVRNWLRDKKPHLAQKIDLVRSPILSDKDNLIGNLNYSLLIMRCVYLSISRPLPNYNDIEGLAQYWKDHYNTKKGKGTPEKFIAAYNRYLQP